MTKISTLMFATQGKAYYEKQGFMPVNQDAHGKVTLSEQQNKLYDKLKKQIHNYKMKHVDFTCLKKSSDNEHLKNILSTKLNNKKIVDVIIWMSKHNKYFSILDEFIKYVFMELHINLPKLWGIKLM